MAATHDQHPADSAELATPQAATLHSTTPQLKPAPAKRSLVPAGVLVSIAAVGAASGVGLMAESDAKLAEARALGTVIRSHRGACVASWSSYDTQCPKLQATLRADDAFHDAAVGAFVASGVVATSAVVYLLWPLPRAGAPQNAAHDIRVAPVFGPANGLQLFGSF